MLATATGVTYPSITGHRFMNTNFLLQHIVINVISVFGRDFFTLCEFRFSAKIPALSEASAAFTLGVTRSWLDFASLEGPFIVTTTYSIRTWAVAKDSSHVVSWR